MHHSSDVIIIGAGPAGLSLATALSQAGLTSTLVEQQPRGSLETPTPDGREIALTHPSVATLQRLGSWAGLMAHEIGHIREAQVHDGPIGQQAAMALDATDSGCDALGYIVPNHALRRSAYEAAVRAPGVHLIAGTRVTQVQTLGSCAEVLCQATDNADHPPLRLTAPLLVAADSRFSNTRRQVGIGAHMTDFGRTVIVCRMRHELPLHEVAHECFGYERTLALLPLPDSPQGHRLCSVVVTTRSDDAQHLMNQSPETFAAEVERQFGSGLGSMTLEGLRHAYPLVAVYAHRFTAPRCALLGDAAVGMHPVTAHGYNLGLAGVDRLTRALVTARDRGLDWGDASSLSPYATEHHRHAWPIFQGTNAIVRLYTDTRPGARWARRLVLQGARRLPPLKAAIVGQLTGRPPAWLAAATPLQGWLGTRHGPAR